MSDYSEAVQVARDYYNSEDADNFYSSIWGGKDLHVGIHVTDKDPIGEASERTVETMAEHLKGIGPDSRGLDAGAGYGGSARTLAGKFGCKMVCANLSEVENKRSREKVKQAGLEHLIQVDDVSFENLPYEDASFDFVWSQDALLHSGDRIRSLKEIDRVLKPGGDFVFTDPMQADEYPEGVLEPVLKRINLATMGSFAFYREQARKLGWEVVDIVDLTKHLPTHYGRVREELLARRDELEGKSVSTEYITNMLEGLGHWVDKGNAGYLAWGIMHFRKPA